MSVPIAKLISEMISRPAADASPGETGYWPMNASRPAPITASVACTPQGYAGPAALFARFEESNLAKRALIVLVQIFAVAETERPAIAVHNIAVPVFGLVGILHDGFARLVFLVLARLGRRHPRLTKFQRHQ
jgi:hypothetical protein